MFTDPQTLSKKSPDQVKVALDLLVDLVKTKQIDIGRVVCIVPYAANLRLVESYRKRPEYSLLQGMPDASTVDSFQGQDNDVVFLIMGTAHPRPGPGFTANPMRLNVMISRQKSALVVIGDINVAKDNEGKVIIHDEWTGELTFMVPRALNALHDDFLKAKRVVTVTVTDKGMERGKGKKEAITGEATDKAA